MNNFLKTLVSSLLFLLLNSSNNHSVVCFQHNIVPVNTKTTLSLPSLTPFHYPAYCYRNSNGNGNACFGVKLSAKSIVDDDDDDDNENNVSTTKTTRKRRTRRKKGSILEDTSISTANIDDVDDGTIVEIKIQDINAVGSSNTNDNDDTMIAIASSNKQQATIMSTATDIPTNDNEVDDKFKSLVSDARRLRESSTQKEGDDAMYKLREIISTIVTIDFFAIVGFLIWFVVGVVSSTILKDDTIQIAFNGIFQPLVQPALGILMIASVASGVTGQEEGE